MADGVVYLSTGSTLLFLVDSEFRNNDLVSSIRSMLVDPVGLVNVDDGIVVEIGTAAVVLATAELFIAILFLSNGLTRSFGLKSGFCWNSRSVAVKTMEELCAEVVKLVSFFGRILLVADDVVTVSVLLLSAIVIDFSALLPVVGVVVVVVVGLVMELNIDVPDALVSLVVLPRFLFAKSYMSPNIPANVLRKFFIVSSASSATEVCDCVGGRCCCG